MVSQFQTRLFQTNYCNAKFEKVLFGTLTTYAIFTTPRTTKTINLRTWTKKTWPPPTPSFHNKFILGGCKFRWQTHWATRMGMRLSQQRTPQPYGQTFRTRRCTCGWFRRSTLCAGCKMVKQLKTLNLRNNFTQGIIILESRAGS